MKLPSSQHAKPPMTTLKFHICNTWNTIVQCFLFQLTKNNDFSYNRTSPFVHLFTHSSERLCILSFTGCRLKETLLLAEPIVASFSSFQDSFSLHGNSLHSVFISFTMIETLNWSSFLLSVNTLMNSLRLF